MRRTEFDSHDPAVIAEILEANKVGRVGIIAPDGYPRIVPVNYVAVDSHIFFHGAPDGEKYAVFTAGGMVSFAVDMPYSTIPSYWLDAHNACPATIFYKSLFLRGCGRIVTDPEGKAKALQALMESEQPEGGYDHIAADNPIYRRRLSGVAIFEIIPNAIDVKLKFAQNRSPDVRRRLISLLRERGGSTDEATAREIEKSLE
jgi:uncharacterized protein